MRLQHPADRRVGPSFRNSIEQQRRGPTPHFARRLSDHGQTRTETGAPGEVVDACDRHILGAAQPNFRDRAHRAERHEIVGAEDRVGTAPGGKEFARAAARVVEIGGALQHKPRNEPRVRHGSAIALDAIVDRIRVQAGAQRGDLTAPDADEVSNQNARRGAVVHDDGIRLDAGEFAVDAYDRQALGDHGPDDLGVTARRRQDQSVDPLLLQHLEIHALLVLVFLGIA